MQQVINIFKNIFCCVKWYAYPLLLSLIVDIVDY